MVPLQPATHAARKWRGAYPTPPELVALVVASTLPPVRTGERVTVLDPACGDGRFLVAAVSRLAAAGAVPIVTGVDIDAGSVEACRRAVAGVAAAARIEHDDALHRDWGDERFDVVLGNPPFLSQLAVSTTRGGSSRHGGGPYADAAAEFLALAVRLARPDGGRVGLVLPQSILAARDTAPVRADVDRRAELTWSWWSPRRLFDAQVLVCALGFELGRRPSSGEGDGRPWSRVVADALGVPPLPPLATAGTLADRASLSADFRGQYYGLIPAVDDHVSGPPLVTSGLIDPGRCRWGEREVTFARRRLARPRVDRARLAPAMRRWAERFTVPKVLVANQTRVIEAVVDDDGSWLPGVPVITLRPSLADVWSAAAVLTSPVASAWAWHEAAGTGLSARALRLGPRWLAGLPWPAGPLGAAVEALRDGDVVACGRAVSHAYGLGGGGTSTLQRWWRSQLPPD